jgi:dethiobiotin synthetase
MDSAGLLLVVAGTGTEIGKTHVSCALLRAWGETRSCLGYKPIETGVPMGQEGEDARSLREASTFHVKPPPYRQTFVEPISPHLAARREDLEIDIDRIVAEVGALRRQVDGVLVELAGGLFSPLGKRLFNAHLALELRPTKLLLVAPDRLGVLHDVEAALLAARAMGLRIEGIALSAPATPDASTGTNADEIASTLEARVLALFPRAPSLSSATESAARGLLTALQLP